MTYGYENTNQNTVLPLLPVSLIEDNEYMTIVSFDCLRTTLMAQKRIEQAKAKEKEEEIKKAQEEAQARKVIGKPKNKGKGGDKKSRDNK